MKPWISYYLPTQEEHANLCFVALDAKIQMLWVFMYITSK